MKYFSIHFYMNIELRERRMKKIMIVMGVFINSLTFGTQISVVGEVFTQTW